MRTNIFAIVAAGLAFSLVGCGSTSGDGMAGSGGSGGSTGATGGTGGTGGSAMMVEVTGTVSAASETGEGTPLQGATVAVVGTSNTAMSDEEGNFSIMAPVGTVSFLTTAAGTWGSLVAEVVTAQGHTGLDLEVIPDALVEGVAAELGLLTPPSTANGLVAVSFDSGTVVGGETASIDVTSGTTFVFDADDAPSIGDTLIADGGTEVIFIDVQVASSVTATATTATAQPCPLEIPDAMYPVQAKVLTEIDVACPPQ